jgi:hypothetical protein
MIIHFNLPQDKVLQLALHHGVWQLCRGRIAPLYVLMRCYGMGYPNTLYLQAIEAERELELIAQALDYKLSHELPAHTAP